MLFHTILWRNFQCYSNLINWQRVVDILGLESSERVKDQYALQAYNHGMNIMRKEPSFSAAYSLLVGSLTQQGKYNEAIDYATKGIALSPDYANLYIRRGYAVLKTKNYKRAIEDYNMGMKQGGSGFVPSIDYKQELDQVSSSTNR